MQRLEQLLVQVWQLASARNCSSSYTCAFYRNEPRPGGWLAF
jgi:hypothetical protein